MIGKKGALAALTMLGVACGGGGDEMDAIYARRMINRDVMVPLDWIALPSTHWNSAWGTGLEYSMDHRGYVCLRGSIIANSSSITVQVATLPAGFRPSQVRRFPAYSNVTDPTQAWIEVAANGNISTGFAADGVIFSLDSVSFPAEQ